MKDNIKYRDFNNLSTIEKIIVNTNLPKKRGIRCIKVLNDWKGNLFCMTNIGLIILWDVLR